MTTDTGEKRLETLVMRHMTGTDGLGATPNMVAERPAPYSGTSASGQEDSMTRVSLDGDRVREGLVWATVVANCCQTMAYCSRRSIDGHLMGAFSSPPTPPKFDEDESRKLMKYVPFWAWTLN